MPPNKANHGQMLPHKEPEASYQILNNHRVELLVCVLLRFLLPLIVIYFHWKSTATIYHVFRLSYFDWEFFSIGLNIIGGTFSMNLLIWKRNLLKQFLKSFRINRLLIEDNFTPRWYHRQLVLFVVVTIYAVATVVLTVYVSRKNDLKLYEQWMESGFFGASVKKWSLKTRRTLVMVDMLCFSCAAVSTGFYFQAGFCYLCLMHSTFLKALETRLRNAEELNKDVMLSFRRQYYTYQDSLKKLNDYSGTVFIIWIGISLISNCRAIELILQLETHDSFLALFYILMYMHSMIGLIAMTACCCGLPSRVASVRLAAQSLTTRIRGSPGQEAYSELQLFLWDLSSPPSGVVAGRCFLVTAPFFLSYVGFAFTYTVIFIQFNPGILQKLQAV